VTLAVASGFGELFTDCFLGLLEVFVRRFVGTDVLTFIRNIGK